VETKGDSTGGPLDKTTAMFDDITSVFALLDEVGADLEADGWERHVS
jgi:hypothetical protein